MLCTRINFIKMAGLIAAVTLAGSAAFAAPESVGKRNVLFIAVDDLKPLAGCYGNKMIKTPNIDRLAESGLVFLNNQCQQAVCAPSRASLLTGMRPDYTKVWDLKTRMRDINPDILTIPQYFKQNGYTSVGMGKIFDYRGCDGYETQDKISWSRPFMQVPDDRYAVKFSDENKIKPSTECADVADNDYYDGRLAEKAVEITGELAQSSKPFFFAVGFKKPHLPFVAPKKYWEMYDRKQFSVHPFQQRPKNSHSVGYHNFGELRSYTDIPDEGKLTEEKQLELIHGYHASVSFVDAQIGKVLDAFEKHGLMKNTVVVLWGDHGWHLGDHGLWCKHTSFEQAARSPLILTAPDLKGSGKTSSPTEFVDIFPTLCDLAGLPVPSHLHGVSLRPLFEKPETLVKEAAVSQFPAGKKIMGYAFRDRRYRYLVWQKKEFQQGEITGPIFTEALYDYQKDPMETVNVVNDPAYKDVVDNFKAMEIVRKTLNL